MTEDNKEPFGDPTTAPFWAAAADHRLVLQHCDDCGHTQFYPRPFCLACESTALSWKEAGGNATVYSMSEVHLAPSPDVEVPYTAAMVELDEGLKRLAKVGDRLVKVVELRFFAGLTIEETAEVLGVSRPIIVSEWAQARTLLTAYVGGGGGGE